MSRLLYIWLFGGLLMMNSCSDASLEGKEYLQWVEEAANGLKKTETFSDYTYTLQYKPVDYAALVEARSVNLSKQELDQKRAELKDFQYYNLRLKAENATELLSSNIQSEEEYYARLNYFVSHAQNDIQLVEAGDTIPCTLYLFERNYGMAPHNDIVLGFNSSNTTDDKTIVFNEQVLGTGTVKFKIRKEDLAKIPTLKTQI